MKKNGFVSSILNEVKSYYQNSNNFLNEEDYSIDDVNVIDNENDNTNLEEYVWNALYNGNYKKMDNCIVIPMGIKGEITIHSDGTANDESDREVNLPPYILDRIKNFFSPNPMYEAFDRVPEGEGLQDDGEELVSRLSEIVDEQDTEFNIEDSEEGSVVVSTNKGISIKIDYDYNVSQFKTTSPTYDTPGDFEFDSSMKPNHVEISDDEVGEFMEVNSPEAMKLADKVLQKVGSEIDQDFIDSHDDDDFLPEDDF